jgi:hypothetical protein
VPAAVLFLYIFAGRGQKIWRGLKQLERLALFLSAHALVRPVLNILQPRALLFLFSHRSQGHSQSDRSRVNHFSKTRCKLIYYAPRRKLSPSRVKTCAVLIFDEKVTFIRVRRFPFLSFKSRSTRNSSLVVARTSIG